SAVQGRTTTWRSICELNDPNDRRADQRRGGHAAALGPRRIRLRRSGSRRATHSALRQVVFSVIRRLRWFAMVGAPGAKAGADPRSVSRDTRRLVAFSDAVFAITITLLVLAIRPPTDYRNLVHGLVSLWPSYLAYAVTFLFIGQVWVNHHVMFDHI